ncbi:MAG TPA: competence/damage-inducible protein A [Vicinamibacterales bacterium]
MSGGAGPRALTRAAIVAVGSELLGTTRIDTNSLYLTEHLNSIGVDVVGKAVVGDDREACAHVVRAMFAPVDLLVVCGGLGPTDDDVTRDVVAAVFERPLREDPLLVEHLRARYAARGYPGAMPENNRRQAMVPHGATVIANAAGSAPGLWLDVEDRVVVLLPGPPRELKPMFAALVDQRLRARTDGSSVARAVIKITGRIESQVDQLLQPLYAEWAAQEPAIAATILAALGQIELHLSTRHRVASSAQAQLAAATAKVLAVVGDDVFSVDGRRLEDVVGGLLTAHRLTVAAAESCTGGLMTSRLTDVPGSSRYVQEAVVAYANETKVRVLGVPAELIAADGAVSESVARAMAEGVRALAGVGIGVGITGIAGPDGGTADKPVGTVAVAVAAAGGTSARMFRFHGERELVKFQASQAGLDMVRRLLVRLAIDTAPGTSTP